MINLKHQEEQEEDRKEENFVTSPKKKKRGSGKQWIILVIIGLVIGGGFWMAREDPAYQAVLLINGQAYFGKIRILPLASTIRLRDVYYLQQNPKAETNPSEPALNLLRRGEEIHNPENAMTIPKNQILFWEKLRPDSRIINLIETYDGK